MDSDCGCFGYCYNRISDEGEWRHKLCGCGDNVPIGCKSFWCPCIMFGQTAREVEESCCGCCCLWILGFAGCFAAMRLRGRIREKHNINGSWKKDCAVATFCGWCSLCQMAQEVFDYKKENQVVGKKEKTVIDDFADATYM